MFYRAYFKTSIHIPDGAQPIVKINELGKGVVVGYTPDKNNQLWLNIETGNFIKITKNDKDEKAVSFGTAEEKIKRENGVECFVFSGPHMEVKSPEEIHKLIENKPEEVVVHVIGNKPEAELEVDSGKITLEKPKKKGKK